MMKVVMVIMMIFVLVLVKVSSLPADILWGLFKRTPKDVCGEVSKGDNDNDDNDGKTKPMMKIGVDDKGENDELW